MSEKNAKSLRKKNATRAIKKLRQVPWPISTILIWFVGIVMLFAWASPGKKK